MPLSNHTKTECEILFLGHENIYGKYAYKTTLNYLEALKKGVEKVIKENINDSELVKKYQYEKIQPFKIF